MFSEKEYPMEITDLCPNCEETSRLMLIVDYHYEPKYKTVFRCFGRFCVKCKKDYSTSDMPMYQVN